MSVSVHAHMRSPRPIPREHRLSVADFQSRDAALEKPVVIPGALEDWKPLQAWPREYVRAEQPTRAVSVDHAWGRHAHCAPRPQPLHPLLPLGAHRVVGSWTRQFVRGSAWCPPRAPGSGSAPAPAGPARRPHGARRGRARFSALPLGTGAPASPAATPEGVRLACAGAHQANGVADRSFAVVSGSANVVDRRAVRSLFGAGELQHRRGRRSGERVALGGPTHVGAALA